MLACTESWSENTGVAIDWRWRSLESFGDTPLEELADEVDLLVIDHPFCGTAAASGCLRPFDTIMDQADLDVLAADAIGASHASYSFAGHQWALATDAACQVSAVRDDLLDGLAPTTWDEVLALARAVPGRVAVPLAPAHAISSFLSLCANAGSPAAANPEQLVDGGAGEQALEIMFELARLGPEAATGWEPPDALAQLCDTDELIYLPLTYGYVTYASGCRFLDLPSAGLGPVGSVLGGAGLAVSATATEPHLAAAFAVAASGSFHQVTFVAPAGGQPGSATAWHDPAIDAAAGGFYSGTIATIEAAWVRPRDAWWPAFQLESGLLLTRSLEERQHPAAVFAALESLYLDHLRRLS